MYNEYRKGYRNNYADHDALQFGLYLEFTRWFNCEYKQFIEPHYCKIRDNKLFNSNNSLFLHFEDFHGEHYQQSMINMLNQIGITQQKYNDTKLFERLLESDLSNKNVKILHCRGHTTRGTFDKDLQIKSFIKLQ